MSKPVPRRFMTPDELLAIAQLHAVTFPVASWDKRFFRNLIADKISENESAQLWRIFIKYRRQMNFPAKVRLLALAETLAAPDLRKLAAAQRAQSEIDEMKRKYKESFV